MWGLKYWPGPPCWLSKHLYRMTVRSPPALSEVSDNQWHHTMTTIEDYNDSLSRCLLACCTHFVILLISFYFCGIKHFRFLCLFLTLYCILSIVEIIFYTCCFSKASDFITTFSYPPLLCSKFLCLLRKYLDVASHFSHSMTSLMVSIYANGIENT